MFMFSPLCPPGSHGSDKEPKGAKEAKEAQGAQTRIRQAETTETHGDTDERVSGGRTSGGRKEEILYGFHVPPETQKLQ